MGQREKRRTTPGSKPKCRLLSCLAVLDGHKHLLPTEGTTRSPKNTNYSSSSHINRRAIYSSHFLSGRMHRVLAISQISKKRPNLDLYFSVSKKITISSKSIWVITHVCEHQTSCHTTRTWAGRQLPTRAKTLSCQEAP